MSGTNTYGQSKGRSGSYSVNWQLAGRELLTPDEVRMLDNQYALLFIRGERPIQAKAHPHSDTFLPVKLYLLQQGHTS